MDLSAKTNARGAFSWSSLHLQPHTVVPNAPCVSRSALRCLGGRDDLSKHKGFCVMDIVTLQDILSALSSAEDALSSADRLERIHDTDDSDTDRHTYATIINYCDCLERDAQRIRSMAERRHRSLSERAATEREMTSYIVKQVMKEEPTMKKATDIAGGYKAAALRRAEGKCELCGQEWRLSVHHIIARTDGGLSESENLIVLCTTCHDEVEDCNYHSRNDVLHHKRAREVSLNQSHGPTPSEKAAITRQENIAKQQQSDAELNAWAGQWDGLFAKCVQYVPLGEKPPADPAWYVIVYGSGKPPAR